MKLFIGPLLTKLFKTIIQFQVHAAASIKMTVFWDADIKWQILTDISEVLTASIIRLHSATSQKMVIFLKMYLRSDAAKRK
jgi:hypothetical protein